MTSSNMTCDAFDTALPDYLEGTLDEKRVASVEGHLSECVRCASLLRDLDNIRRDAAELPDLAPSRDLWEGIVARIAAPVIPLAPRPERQRRLAPAWLGIAAAALVVSTAGITYMLTARSIRPASTVVALVNPPTPTASSATPDSSGTSTVASSQPVATSQATAANNGGAPRTSVSRLASSLAPVPQTNAAAQFVSGDQARSDAVYGREIEMLQSIVRQRKTVLDSSTVTIIEKNLRIIDAAIEQSRAALEKDPASRLLGQQLTHALDKKVELLRTAAMLPAST
ncbi:MAG TPA: zf-HC2 domain-containing protein [Gemmatimonadaceae bacterium]|nr:zf-HC2 domain-containing protein [Gemmatimonadaceae bacterium]